MSQNHFTLQSGRSLLYGLDLPTGGFFYTEFLTDEEIETSLSDDEVYFSEAGLTLTELEKGLMSRYDFSINPLMMLTQMMKAQYPTQFQISVGRAFGKDVPEMIKRVEKDILERELCKQK